MKLFRMLLPALLLAAFAIAPPSAHAQYAPVNCAPATACVNGVGPYNTGTGDHPADGFGKINANFAAIPTELFSTHILTVPHGGTGVATLTGPIKGNGASAFSAAAAADIVGLFSTCSGTQYLGADGSCHNASGAGTVTSVAATVPTFLSISGSPITTSGTLAISLSGTALPAANGGTGLTALGSGVATFLATPSSANLASALTNETGTGLVVFNTSPALTTPTLSGSSSGVSTLASANASATNYTLTFPAITDTIATLTATQTLTNKSIAATEVNSATLGAAQMPALTGDVTSTVGTVATTVGKLNGTSLAGLATGILKNTTATGVPSIASSADVYGLWSGTCSSSTFLRGDGSCQTPAGGGNVSNSGTPTQYQTGVWASATTILGVGPGTTGQAFASTGAASNPAFTSSLSGVTSVNGTTIPSSATLLTSGGALGTPSSGTLTNATGLPFSGLATGTDTTATLTVGTGGTLTYSGSGVVNANQTGGVAFGTFATQNYATPPAIGGTTPAAGAFTTLSATGNLTTNVTGSTQCLQASSGGVVSGTGSTCGSGGSTAFSALTGSTNTTAAMVVGTGASLATSGTGTVSATSLTALTGLPTIANNTILANTSGSTAAPAATSAAATLGLLQSITCNAQTGTTYTTVLGDGNGCVTMSNTSPNTVTVPANASVAYAVGTTLTLQEINTGITTISPAAGVTLCSLQYGCSTSQTYALAGNYDFLQIQQTTTNNWLVTEVGPGRINMAGTTNLASTAFGGVSGSLPIGSVSGLGTGVATFLTTPSSANLASAVTGATGSGALVFGTSPTFTTGTTLGFITGSTQCLHVNTSGAVSGTGSDCGSGGSTAFSALTGSTNTTAAMVVGTGASLATSGTGTITASGLNATGLGTANTWTAVQDFTKGDFQLSGTSTGNTTLNSGLAGSSNNTLTLPITATDTLAALGTAETWTAAQTFTNSDIKLLGSSTGVTTFTSNNASATNYTLTIPAASDTVDVLGTAQTFTAAKTFTNSDLLLLGSSTGATTFTSANVSATAYTATVPANTGTLAELNLAETWSALQTFGTNISIGGVTATGATGTGAVVFGTSPTLATPALGTPSAINLTNAAAGSLPLTAVATIANNTILANGSGSTASASATTAPNVIAILNAPTCNAQTGTTYTGVLGDANGCVTMSNSSANTFTVPPNSGVAYPVGTTLTVEALGTGITTITPGAGVTLQSPQYGASTSISYNLVGAYDFAQFKQISANAWLLTALGPGRGTAPIDVGTKFTLGTGTGTCATSSTLVGGAATGKFTCTGTSGASTQVINLPTAPNGWVCEGNDLTTTTDTVHQTASATNSATLSGTIVANDVVNFMCSGY